MSKTRIVWMCTFDVKYIKKKEIKFINNYDPVVTAPWINLLIDGIKHNTNIELHIFALYYKIKKDYHFCEDGINYHFYSQKLPLLNKTSPAFVKKITNYYFLKRRVIKTLNKINPDIIHIHGTDIDLAEINVYKNIPVILTPTTINIHAYEFYKTKFYKNQTERENRLFKRMKYFGIRANYMKEIINKQNPYAKFYWHFYPTLKPIVNADNYPIKDADIIFAARLNKNKGIEDLLKSLAQIKVMNSNISLKIIGDTGSKEYEIYIQELVKELGIEQNVRFLGRKETQEEMYIEIAKSKIYVLPTYFDIIPGSIIEAMCIGVPVISYPVGGIPELNAGDARIHFARKGDINDLSNKIVELLENLPVESIKNAKTYAETEYSNEKAIQGLLKAYNIILGETNV